VCGPFPRAYDFHKDDFTACLRSGSLLAMGIAETIRRIGQSPDADVVLIASLIAQQDPSTKELEDGVVSGDKQRGAHPGFTAPSETTVQLNWNGYEHAKGGESRAMFDVYALLDPVSPQTQRTSAILLHLLKTLKDQVSLVLTLNPPLRLEEVPIKRFYRYVAPRLTDSTEPKKQSHANFGHLPLDVLLSCSDLDTPRAWLTMPFVSVHDLDNIKLDNLVVSGGVEAVFTLKEIMVEGHALDVEKRPPRGLQLELLNGEQIVHDTIVMANYGYFQLQAPTPGLYTLAVRKGRSRTVAKMTYVGDDSAGLFGNGMVNLLDSNEDPEAVIISKSFEGLTLFIRVAKKTGMEKMDFLDDGTEKTKRGFWDNIKDKFSGGQKQADINIFSVASGHLYERFMSIMFLSVLRHTKHTVKFWLIENFMSPSFKQFLPKLSKHYGFQYELVTYKWPHWLRAQTEKQRTIWAYKILFLDVLFPLQLDRVIFVDADQIVRTDMFELADMDIKNAAYAYTPMGDSRAETEGYRFWKQGYWLNHLQGRPYHISALYLVDLVRFRGIAAGDRLRAQYQGLSADPESLANLDQDLPNSMMDQVPMFSLPQDWLWCETWCSDESLTTAKTIDLVRQRC
jgi:UDP-glucose:glycoprotein glucosyltransferase